MAALPTSFGENCPYEISYTRVSSACALRTGRHSGGRGTLPSGKHPPLKPPPPLLRPSPSSCGEVPPPPPTPLFLPRISTIFNSSAHAAPRRAVVVLLREVSEFPRCGSFVCPPLARRSLNTAMKFILQSATNPWIRFPQSEPMSFSLAKLAPVRPKKGFPLFEIFFSEFFSPGNPHAQQFIPLAIGGGVFSLRAFPPPLMTRISLSAGSHFGYHLDEEEVISRDREIGHSPLDKTTLWGEGEE